MQKKAGFTSTIPVECVFAAGMVPVDINNLFVTAPDPAALVAKAKMEGFPDTTCAWICGLFSTILQSGIDTLIGVTGGDCSETLALMEILRAHGINVIPFGYPHQPSETAIEHAIQQLCADLGTSFAEASSWKNTLDPLRKRVHRLDDDLWQNNNLDPAKVQLAQLCCSDFLGSPENFATMLDTTDFTLEQPSSDERQIRLGYIGVPTIITDLYQRIADYDTRIVFHEVQRQFSLPAGESLTDAYTRYTYPYGIFHRLDDIKAQIKARRIDGIIHYVQSFCFRGIEDMIVRRELDVPVLTLQGDLPSCLTGTMEIRIEAFLDMLRRRKKARA